MGRNRQIFFGALTRAETASTNPGTAFLERDGECALCSGCLNGKSISSLFRCRSNNFEDLATSWRRATDRRRFFQPHEPVPWPDRRSADMTSMRRIAPSRVLGWVLVILGPVGCITSTQYSEKGASGVGSESVVHSKGVTNCRTAHGSAPRRAALTMNRTPRWNHV